MARGKHLINVHTGTGTTEPSGASLYLGEIAVQHTPEEPALWIKVGTSEDSEVYEKFIGKTEITNIFNDTKILGSGYTYSGLPYVNSATTLADAYSALTNEVILDEKVTSAALNDLNDRVKEISAATGDNTEILEYIQENEEVVAGTLNNLNDRVATVETHMTGDYIPLEGYVLASGLTEEELMITSADTVNEAFGKIQKQNLDNEEAIAASLNDLNGRLVDVAEEVARNTGVTVLSGVVTNLVGKVEGQGTALRALSSATRSLSSATQSLSSATQSLSGVVRTISGKTNGVLTLTMNGVEQGKYSPSASTTINLEAIQDVTGADVLLTGYELASGTTEEELAIVPTDTVNEAFGKIQKQNYDNEAVIAGAMNHFNEILLGFSGIIIDDEYVTAAALNDLDSRLDVVEESTTGVSGLSEDVQALSASVEDFEEIAAAAFNDLNDRIEALSASSVDPSIVQKVETLSSHVETNEFVTAAALNDLNARIIELSGNSVDTALTLDVQELSGTVIDLQAEIASSSGLAALSAAVVTISGQVSANTTNIEALSGKVLNNDLVIAAIFNDLNDRVIELSGDTNEEILDILAKIDEISGNTGGGGGGGTDVAPLSAAVLSLSAAVVTISGNSGGGGADLGPLSASVVTNKNNITALSAGTVAHTADTSVHPTYASIVASGFTKNGVTGTGLTADKIVLGNGGTAVKTSVYEIYSAGEVPWSDEDKAIPTFAHLAAYTETGTTNALSAATTAMSANVAKIAVTGVTVTGTGNAVTNAAYANSALTLTKGNVLTAETLTGVSAGGTNVTVTNKIAAIPSASSSAFGVVKTGNFLTNTNGTIAVSTGTTNATVAVGNHTHTASEVGALPTGTTLDNVADGTTRKLSNYATTGTVDTLSAATTAMSVNVGKIAVTGVTVTGTGNAVTNAAYSNSALTLTKGNVLTAETLTGVSLAGTAVTLSSKVAPIPSASTSAFGVVKTGTFIGNNNGTITVSTGTTNTTVARGDQFLAVSGATTANTGNINTLSSATRAHTATTIANGTSSQMHLPTVSASDNGKILMVKNGAWVLETPVSIYTGSGTPSQSLGNDGDIYLQTS